jgi:hypothetical protein
MGLPGTAPINVTQEQWALRNDTQEQRAGLWAAAGQLRFRLRADAQHQRFYQPTPAQRACFHAQSRFNCAKWVLLGCQLTVLFES